MKTIGLHWTTVIFWFIDNSNTSDFVQLSVRETSKILIVLLKKSLNVGLTHELSQSFVEIFFSSIKRRFSRQVEVKFCVADKSRNVRKFSRRKTNETEKWNGKIQWTVDWIRQSFFCVISSKIWIIFARSVFLLNFSLRRCSNRKYSRRNSENAQADSPRRSDLLRWKTGRFVCLFRRRRTLPEQFEQQLRNRRWKRNSMKRRKNQVFSFFPLKSLFLNKTKNFHDEQTISTCFYVD